MAAIGIPYDRAQYREVRTLSGGEQKRLALEALLRGPDEVLLLDEPDNYLDVPGKQWLESQLAADAEDGAADLARPRAACACGYRIVTVEGGTSLDPRWRASPRTTRHAGTDTSAWTSCVARWDEKHQQLKDLVRNTAAARRTTTRTWRQVPGDADAADASSRRLDRRKRDPAAAERPDASEGRTHRRPRHHLSAARADRADEAVRPRGLLRRAGRRSGQQRLWQVTLSAPTCWRVTREHPPSRTLAVEARGTRRAWALRADARPRRVRRSDARSSCCGSSTHCSWVLQSPRYVGTSSTTKANSGSRRLSGGQQARFQILLLELSGVTLAAARRAD